MLYAPALNISRCSYFGGVALVAGLIAVATVSATSIFDDDWTPPPPIQVQPAKVAPPAEMPDTPPTRIAAKPPVPETKSERTPPSPIPAPAAQQKSRTLLKDLYHQQLSDGSLKGKQALSHRLMEDAAKAADAPSDRFVMLTGARQAAVDCGDVALALKVDDELCRSYAIDAHASRLDLLTQLSKTTRGPASANAVVAEALQQSDDAERRGQYEASKQFAEVALIAVKTSDKSTLRVEASQREASARALSTAYAELDQPLAILRKSPADPGANLSVGRFYCLMVGQWSTGLRFLAAGSDAKLSVAAKDDIQGKDAFSIAEGWRLLAEPASANEKRNMRLRAGKWYADALPTLTGLEKLKAQRELAQLNVVENKSIYLPDMKETHVEGIVQEREWTLSKNVLNSNNVPLAIGGIPYAHGLGFNPGDGQTVKIDYVLDQPFKRFTGLVGVNDTGGGFEATLTFRILGNGKLLWKSAPCHKAGRAQPFDVDVSGVTKLELIVDCPATAHGAHVAWVDPRLNPA